MTTNPWKILRSVTLMTLLVLGISVFCFPRLRTYFNGEDGVPEVTVSFVTCDPATRTLLIQLTVTNVGDRLLVIPGLREHDFQHCQTNWNGWILFIWNLSDPRNGEFGFADDFPSGICQNFSRLRNIRLAPGEQYNVTLNIAEARWISNYYEPDDKKIPQYLIDTPGEYKVSFRLTLLTDNIPVIARWGLWRGVTETSIIHFSIPAHENQK